MIDFELGDVTLWVAFERGKPFPITIYKKDGQWLHAAYPSHDLKDRERIELEGFVKDRLSELSSVWKSNMSTRLSWDVTALKKKKGT